MITTYVEIENSQGRTWRIEFEAELIFTEVDGGTPRPSPSVTVDELELVHALRVLGVLPNEEDEA